MQTICPIMRRKSVIPTHIEHDLPDVVALFHVSMCGAGICQIKLGVEYRRDLPRSEQWPDVVMQLLRDLRFGRYRLRPQC